MARVDSGNVRCQRVVAYEAMSDLLSVLHERLVGRIIEKHLGWLQTVKGTQVSETLTRIMSTLLI